MLNSVRVKIENMPVLAVLGSTPVFDKGTFRGVKFANGIKIKVGYWIVYTGAKMTFHSADGYRYGFIESTTVSNDIGSRPVRFREQPVASWSNSGKLQ